MGVEACQRDSKRLVQSRGEALVGNLNGLQQGPSVERLNRRPKGQVDAVEHHAKPGVHQHHAHRWGCGAGAEGGEKLGVSGVGSARERKGAFVNGRGDHGVEPAIEAVLGRGLNGARSSLSAALVNRPQGVGSECPDVSQRNRVKKLWGKPEGLAQATHKGGVCKELKPMSRQCPLRIEGLEGLQTDLGSDSGGVPHGESESQGPVLGQARRIEAFAHLAIIAHLERLMGQLAFGLGSGGLESGGLELWLVLGLAALLAGFVDAVVGGGGLIQVPALFSSLPTASAASLLGTAKLSSIAGTTLAAWRYLRVVRLDPVVAGGAVLGAACCAWLGAAVVSWLPRHWADPMVLVLMVLVAIATLRRREMGLVHEPRWSGKAALVPAVITGGLMGFYDGFFGPGTGAFLIFIFVRSFHYDFLHASAISKLVNWVTNFFALAFFVPAGQVFWALGGLMAACNILGAVLGTRFAVQGGSVWVRRLFIGVLLVMIARMTWVVIQH